jgi:esterase
MDPRALASDLVRFMDEHELDTAMLVGHGLGGTAAMATALHHGDRVDRLMVVDTATNPPPNRGLRWVVAAMASVPLGDIRTRADADALLAIAGVSDAALRQFALQNLVLGAAGGQASWRVNLDAFQRDDTDDGLQLDQADAINVTPYDGDALFLVGAKSDHVDVDAAKSTVQPLFPHARFESLDAGHWLHLEKPHEFVAEVMRFAEG